MKDFKKTIKTLIKHRGGNCSWSEAYKAISEAISACKQLDECGVDVKTLWGKFSAMEKKSNEYKEDAAHKGMEVFCLEKKLSAMEKALKEIIDIPNRVDYEEYPAGQVDAMCEVASHVLGKGE